MEPPGQRLAEHGRHVVAAADAHQHRTAATAYGGELRLDGVEAACNGARDLARSRIENGGAPAVANRVAGRRRGDGFEPVVDPCAERLVVLSQPGELPGHRVPQSAEVADHDDQGSGPRHPARARQCDLEAAGRVSAPGLVLEPGEDPEEGQRPAPSPLDAGFGGMAAGERQPADAIAVRHRGPCEQRGGLGRHHRLERPPGAEAHVLAEVHDEEDRAVALLVEELGMDPAGAGRHPPVDAADVVAGQVAPRLRVLHPAPPEPRYARPAPAGPAGALRIQGEAGRPRAQADEIGGGERHPRQPARSAARAHGTATIESSASTTRSASTPSASASKLGSTRCRSTSWAIDWTSWGAT